MRCARSRPGPLFFSSTAVVFAEIIKAIVSISLLWAQKNLNMRELFISMSQNLSDPADNLKIFVLSLLFVIQNNLLYLGISLLDAATFQVSSQLKIITTALFSILILPDCHYSLIQWLALIFLFLGVALVQLDAQHLKVILANNSSTSNSSRFLFKQNNSYKTSAIYQNFNQNLNNNTLSSIQLQSFVEFPNNSIQLIKSSQQFLAGPLLGFFAVLLASIISGFANVYFEKVLKSMHVCICKL